MSGVREIDRADPALATCLVGDAPSAMRGLIISGCDCGSQYMAHDFLRVQPGCLGEEVIQQKQTGPGFVLAVLCDGASYDRSKGMIDFMLAMQSLLGVGVPLVHVSTRFPGPTGLIHMCDISMARGCGNLEFVASSKLVSGCMLSWRCFRGITAACAVDT